MILHEQSPAWGSPGEVPTLFFEGGHHRRRAHAQHAGRVADAAAIQRHLHHLLFDSRLPPRVVLQQEKDPPLAGGIITPIAVFAIGLLPIFHHLPASTLRTLYRDNRHNPSSFRWLTTELILSLQLF